MPYFIVILTQIEQYKYLSYKLDIVGFRLEFIDILNETLHLSDCLDVLF